MSIEWTVLPADAIKTGCVNQTLTTDTAAHQPCSAAPTTARVGNNRRGPDQGRQDAPGVTGAEPARDADTNGWYNHAVGVEFEGDDLTSGPALVLHRDNLRRPRQRLGER